jgi:hypothetical protein
MKSKTAKKISSPRQQGKNDTLEIKIFLAVFPAVLSQLSYAFCVTLLSYPCCLVRADLSLLYCPCCLVLAVLSLLCPCCFLVIAAISYPGQAFPLDKFK